MKKLTLLFLTLCAIANAQDQNFFNPITQITKIPQSPEAAAFEKFSGSVNMFTGTPGISIPIYTLKGKEISVPVSLSYDASGIKVDQIASNVGLGWNLNVGGVVTRTVNGLPDEYVSIGRGGDHHHIWGNVGQEYLDKIFDDPILHGNYTGGYNSAVKGILIYNLYQDNRIDFQPDTYSFNVNGLSGTFVIDYSITPHKAYCIDNPDIIIELDWGTGEERFLITGPDGTKYYFGKAENTHQWISPDPDDDPLNDNYLNIYTTAWYVSDMVSANGIDHFRFSYGEGLYLDREPAMETQQMEAEVQTNVTDHHLKAIRNVALSEYKKEQLAINAIEYKNSGMSGFKTVMTTDTYLRDDLPGVWGISRINFMDKVTAVSANATVLEVEFDHNNYFGDGTNAFNKRLRLDGLKIYRDDPLDPKEYRFEYYSPTGVPDRKGYSVDFWGYNNDKQNNHLAPTPNCSTCEDTVANYDPDFQNISITQTPQGEAPADRRPVFNATLAGTLKKITYPTGGTSTYFYEQHKVKDFDNQMKVVGGLRLQKVINDTDDPNGEDTSYETHYFYDDITEYPSLIPSNPTELDNIRDDYSSGVAQQNIVFNETKMIETPQNTTSTVGVQPKKYLTTFNRAVDVPNDITYTKVSEIRFKKTGTDRFNGATVTHFHNGRYDGSNEIAEEARPFHNVNLEYGDVEYQRVYDKNNILLQETFNDFTTDILSAPQNQFPAEMGLYFYANGDDQNDPEWIGGTNGCHKISSSGTTSYKIVFKDSDCPSGTVSETEGPYSHYYSVPSYTYVQKWKKHISSTTTVHEGSISQTSSTTYMYNGSDHYFPTDIETVDSRGGTQTTEIKYPSDSAALTSYSDPDNALATMVARNQLGVPIEVVKTYDNINGTNNVLLETSRQRRFYGDFTKQGHPFGYTMLMRSKVEVSKTGINGLEERMLYTDYDIYGNLRTVKYPSGMEHAYIWGYQGEHLLMEIKNSDSANWPDPLFDNVISDSDVEDSVAEEDDLRDDLNALRANGNLSGTQITTYTHDPGIGIKSMTDVRGRTTFYKYDGNSRLEFVLDNEGKVTGKNEYNLREND